MKRIILLLGIVLLVAPLTVKAQVSDAAKKSLRGLKGVYVLVEELTDEVQRQELDNNQLQTDAELRLRKAGIRVATKTEAIQSDDIGILYINVGMMQLHSGLCVVSESVDLQQSVRLIRDNSIIVNSATTYRIRASFGTVACTKFREDARTSINDKVDVFINDYLAMNGK